MLKNSIASVVLLLITCQYSLFSQNKYNFTQFRDETFDFVKQPARWEGNDWLKLGIVGAGTFLVMQADRPVRDAVMRDQSYYNSAPVIFGKMWGDNYTTLVVAGLFAARGLLTNDNSTKKVGFEIIQAALYSGGITAILKVVAGRARPYTNEGPADYRPITMLDDGFHSLPSGHTTLAFALSTVLSRNVHSTALKVLAYVPAALTAFSRVYQDYHWVSDCVLAAVIGYVSAAWIVDLHDQKDSPVHVSSIYPLTIRISLD
jgi:membrane-associated phospholipid phosphatase